MNTVAWEGSINPKVCFLLIILRYKMSKFLLSDIIPQGHLSVPLKGSILMLQVNNFQKVQDCLLPVGIRNYI